MKYIRNTLITYLLFMNIHYSFSEEIKSTGCKSNDCTIKQRTANSPPEGAWTIIYTNKLEHRAGVITSTYSGFIVDRNKIYNLVFSEGRDDPNANTIPFMSCQAKVDPRYNSLTCINNVKFTISNIYMGNDETNLCQKWFATTVNQNYKGVLSYDQTKAHMHSQYICYYYKNPQDPNGPGGGSGTGGNTSGG